MQMQILECLLKKEKVNNNFCISMQQISEHKNKKNIQQNILPFIPMADSILQK